MSFSIAFFFLIGHFYFHELGHILLGILSNIILGYIPHGLHLTGWRTLCGFPYPTQTKFDSIINNPLYAFGGPIFTCVWGLLIVFIINKFNQTKEKKRVLINAGSILIILNYFIEAIIGNVLFGTDNWINKPILNWNDYPIFNTIYSYQGLFILIIMTITFLFCFISLYKTNSGKIQFHLTTNTYYYQILFKQTRMDF